MTNSTPPIIIIGMHRSGTSMLTNMLNQLGLFIGHKLLPFDLYEASFFVTLNEWLLAQANASWDNPYNYQFADTIFNEQAKSILLGELKGKKKKNFLGKHKVKDIRDLNIPWAWKDPRTTITIDLWKDIFPEAKILHIYRNPIDVAASLSKREKDIRQSKKLTYAIRVLRFLNYKATQNLSLRIMNVEEGVKLWEDYVSKAFSLDEKYGGDIYHLRYESFLEHPMQFLPEIAEFAGLHPTQEKMKDLVKNVNSDRMFAFTKKPELVEIYKKVQQQDWIKQLGYGEILS
ncbi:MAG: sulfotransferase [Bacteroidetes bacterium]|nr:sulfotransferase [Bacteroidota bacterium]